MLSKSSLLENNKNDLYSGNTETPTYESCLPLLKESSIKNVVLLIKIISDWRKTGRG